MRPQQWVWPALAIFIFLAVAITAIINFANPSIVDRAFAVTRLAQGACAAVVVCAVGVIFNSSRAALNVAVGVASLVTIMALLFVTWNLSEILEYRPASQNQNAAAN